MKNAWEYLAPSASSLVLFLIAAGIWWLNKRGPE